MRQMPKIVAGMPAYNEEKYIGTLVLQTRQHVDEVIVVDDGSTDATAEIAELAGARVIRHMSNRGYGAAIQSIFAEDTTALSAPARSTGKRYLYTAVSGRTLFYAR
jgi:glycosyltransferase involved in cell wall biosynthesis